LPDTAERDSFTRFEKTWFWMDRYVLAKRRTVLNNKHLERIKEKNKFPNSSFERDLCKFSFGSVLILSNQKAAKEFLYTFTPE
jgi:hypothetical protein